MTVAQTFLFHDFETFGIHPAYDRPCQFAGIRTDSDFNPIDKPLTIFSQPTADYLPSPEACLITGITPQIAMQQGMNEASFIKRIHQEMMVPQTCSLGYNTLRFDDEVTRHTLFRNFHDPYAREWQNGNSRWDLIDLVRACYALRPDGITWPEREDGLPSFKLEHLSAANGLAHEHAHDALSDVHATVALAKKLKEAQPKLFSYFQSLRSKHEVKALINTQQLTPLVHISGRISSAQGCCAWVVPIMWHPQQPNKVLVINLTMDIAPLLELSAETLAKHWFTAYAELETAGQKPVPLKWIQINKCPIVAPAKTLLPENAQRLGIDREACLQQLATLKQHQTMLQEKLGQMVVCAEREPTEQDADASLYDGFANEHDKALINHIAQLSADELMGFHADFHASKYQKLLFRYRARNWPQSLNADEQQRWMEFCRERLYTESAPWMTLARYLTEIERLAEVHQHDSKKMRILQQLYLYAEQM